MTSKRKIFRILLGICTAAALAHLVLAFSGTSYLYKALWYNYVDLDDYKIFHNSTLREAEMPQPWPAKPSPNTISDTLANYLDSTETKAILVIKNDTVVFEKYFDGYTDTTISNSFSVAKSFVSAAIGMALKEGKIKSVDQRVSEFLPEFSKGKKATIMLKHLLTMSSGLNWDESYAAPISTTTESYYGEDIAAIIHRLEVVDTPGTVFRYKSGDTQILAMILKKATGKTVSEYTQQLWNHTGATHSALWSLERKGGNEKAYCCLNATARDFARLGYLYLHQGNWKGRQLIDSAYVQASWAPCQLPDGDLNMAPSDFYGYQWWMLPSEKIYYARGILGQYVIVLPEENMVIVRLGALRGQKLGKHYRECLSLAREVRKWK